MLSGSRLVSSCALLLVLAAVRLAAAPKGIPDTLEFFEQKPWASILDGAWWCRCRQRLAWDGNGGGLVAGRGIPGVPHRLVNEAAGSSAGVEPDSPHKDAASDRMMGKTKNCVTHRPVTCVRHLP